MDNPAPTILGLCSGIGMLETAVSLILPTSRVACSCEWETYAATVQLARMEDKSLEPHPIWCGDLGGFDAKPFLGVVDILTAGLPCQPYSCAGKQHGNADARSWGDGDGPIPQFLRIVSECRPAVVFLENVSAWVVGGHFRPVGEQLCGMGYEIEEPIFIAAEDVGATHRRERVFILAHRKGGRFRELRESPGRDGFAYGSREAMAHMPSERGKRWSLSESAGREHGPDVDGSGEQLGDSEGRGRGTRWTNNGERRADAPFGSVEPVEDASSQQRNQGSASESRQEGRRAFAGDTIEVYDLGDPDNGRREQHHAGQRFDEVALPRCEQLADAERQRQQGGGWTR